MIQLAINNQPVESYFKNSEAIKDFLENAVSLDLMSILNEIKSDKLHQKTLSDIKNKAVNFHGDANSLIKALNE